MADHWFVVAPVGESHGTALDPQVPKRARIVSTPVNSKADKAWTGNGAYQGFQVFQGPFNSESDAKNAHAPGGLSYLAILGASAVSAGTEGALSASSAVGANASTTFPNPFQGVADTAASLAKIGAAIAWFFDEIANVHLWASVMWILAGTIALFVGVYLWLRTQGIEPPLPIPIPI